jgi:hypothetical protein
MRRLHRRFPSCRTRKTTRNDAGQQGEALYSSRTPPGGVAGQSHLGNLGCNQLDVKPCTAGVIMMSQRAALCLIVLTCLVRMAAAAAPYGYLDAAGEGILAGWARDDDFAPPLINGGQASGGGLDADSDYGCDNEQSDSGAR